jgi:AraC family transcriptional regulator
MAAKVSSDKDQPFRTIGQADFGKFKLIESASRGGVIVPVHSHEETHLTLILEGICRETYLGSTHDIGGCGVTSFHPGESHGLELHGKTFRTFDVGFDGVWIDELLEKPLSPTLLTRAQSQTIAGLTMRLYEEFREMDDVSEIAMEGLALELIALLARAGRPPANKRAPRWLAQVEDLIRDEFARPLTLTELASAVGIHPAHLAQVFRQQHHCTPGEFIRRVRIEQAIKMMSDSRTPLADISVATGFSDQSHFSRVFKRAMGMPPARFRQLRDGE